MPISKYFGGSGSKVMSSMKKEYGSKKGKSVFYATANSQDETPKKKKTHDAGPSKKFKMKLGV